MTVVAFLAAAALVGLVLILGGIRTRFNASGNFASVDADLGSLLVFLGLAAEGSASIMLYLVFT